MRMREYIEIQSNTATSDGQGGGTPTWTKVTNEWAKAEVLSMSRTLDGQGIKYTRAVRFTMRRRDDTPTDTYTLGGEHRIVWDGFYYTIHSVTPDELASFVVVLAYTSKDSQCTYLVDDNGNYITDESGNYVIIC